MKRHVLQGIDRIDTIHPLLHGKRLGLITNPSGVNRTMDATIDLLHACYNLTALFSCEHGVRGDAQAGAKIESYTDPETGIPVYSLYGDHHHLDAAMADAFDLLVFDIQDIGVRYYTYLYTLGYALEDCAAFGKPIVVLDRTNPIGGSRVEGTLLDEAFRSFIGEYAMPTRFGLTIGEFARFVCDYRKLDCDLTVVPCEGWNRSLFHDETDLHFLPPSPNIPTVQSALAFVATCPFEGTNFSEGRGTTTPFELVGAPWVDSTKWQQAMRAYDLPGILFRRACFTPTFQKHQDTLCHGLQLIIDDRAAAEPFKAGLLMLETARTLWPDDFEWRSWGAEAQASYPIDRLLGTDAYRLGKADALTLYAQHAPQVQAFAERSRAYHLYE